MAKNGLQWHPCVLYVVDILCYTIINSYWDIGVAILKSSDLTSELTVDLAITDHVLLLFLITIPRIISDNNTRLKITTLSKIFSLLPSFYSYQYKNYRLNHGMIL